MLQLLADENFNRAVVRGVRLRLPEVDFARVQEVGLSGSDDPTILEWAANNGRVLFTHDVSTMTRYAQGRVNAGKPMPGAFEVGRHVSIAVAIDEIVLLVECSFDGEWESQVRYLPLR